VAPTSASSRREAASRERHDVSGAASRDLPVPERALAVGAHPDDVEFQAGATLAKWAAAGCEVSILICTDGSKGTWDPHADLDALVAIRRREAAAAARALGARGEVVDLGRVDGELEDDRATRSEVAREIRRLRPDVLLGHDPWKRYRLHPDHRAAGFLVCDALVAARDPHFFPEHGVPHHRPATLLLFEAEDPDHAESVEPHHVDAKIAALEAHRSQYESTMFISAEPDAGEVARAERQRFHDEIRAGVAEAGRWAGLERAERFRLLPTARCGARRPGGRTRTRVGRSPPSSETVIGQRRRRPGSDLGQLGGRDLLVHRLLEGGAQGGLGGLLGGDLDRLTRARVAGGRGGLGDLLEADETREGDLVALGHEGEHRLLERLEDVRNGGLVGAGLSGDLCDQLGLGDVGHGQPPGDVVGCAGRNVVAAALPVKYPRPSDRFRGWPDRPPRAADPAGTRTLAR
jgi:LmbE family N-acetylglucosaminyl deacetylase